MGYIKTREQAVAIIAECLEQKNGDEIAEMYIRVVGAAAVYDEKEDIGKLGGQPRSHADEVEKTSLFREQDLILK